MGTTVLDSMDYIDRKVQFLIIHPKYDPKGTPKERSYDSDLALLKFKEPIKFKPNLIPICLPDENEDFAGQTGWTTGWGQLDEKGKKIYLYKYNSLVDKFEEKTNLLIPQISYLSLVVD